MRAGVFSFSGFWVFGWGFCSVDVEVCREKFAGYRCTGLVLVGIEVEGFRVGEDWVVY